MDDKITALLKAGRVNEARVLTQGDGTTHAWVDAIERFNHQNSFGPHRAFDHCGTDWKRYFFTHDGLHNTNDDIVFSIYDRYKCDIGCKTCYLNGYWMTDGEFKSSIPAVLTSEMEQRFLQVFEHFYRVGSIDDLATMKVRHPHLFEFFKRHSSLMEHNITDNGFFSQYNILMNDCHFAYTAYLSFSDNLLGKNDGAVVDKIIPMLEKLHARSPVRKINFILSQGQATDNPHIMRLFNWIVDNTQIETFFHTDLCKDVDNVSDLKLLYGYDLPSVYYQENTRNPPVVCQILTETVQMRGTKFFSTLTGSTVNRDFDPRISLPFHDCANEWNADVFLADLLKGKLQAYDYYQDIMTQKSGNRYWEYFHWCVENLQVRDDFSFIPTTMMNPWSNMSKTLQENSWVNTHAGMLYRGSRPVGDGVVPIVMLKDKR